MISRNLFFRSAGLGILIGALALMILAAGCTTQENATPGPVHAVKFDPSHITVDYQGGPGTETLIELEITVTDSNKKTVTQSLGSRLATTPVRINSSATFTGSYSESSHVVVIGYFSDGTKKTMLDTTL
ncbi:MAG: hypothetical protein LUP97_02595 [Methanoregula sp.]|nr:hypothetical protein [Methanoregula sp.]